MFDIIGRGGGGGGGGHGGGGGGHGGGGFPGGGGGFHGGGFNRGFGFNNFSSPWWGGYGYPYYYPYAYPVPLTQPTRRMTPAVAAAYNAWQQALAANADPTVVAKLKALFESALYGLPY